MRASPRDGFTLIELLIVMSLMAIVGIKLSLLIKEASKVERKESALLALEDQAQRLLDKIAFSIVGADSTSLTPDAQFPFATESLRYQVSLGVEEGVTVWSDPEVIGQDEERPNQLFWAQNHGEENEQLLVWCNALSELMQDELENGSDDNENGLTDEAGVNFVIDRESVAIRLTLERGGKDGSAVRCTKETTITCRN